MVSASESGARFAKSRLSVLVAETRCALRTAWLLFRNRIALPRQNIGKLIEFADGSRSVVYRETAMRDRHSDRLVLIIVRFRLRFIGHSRLAHWLFRAESLLNTFLFAAHPGFETKLWLTDPDTGYYRGIYEWKGRREAIAYAGTLRVVLRPWVAEGSFAYQVVEDLTRADYLAGLASRTLSRPEDGWWQTASSSPVAAGADELR